MSTELKPISPESLEVAQVYLTTELDSQATAHELDMSLVDVQKYLRKPEIKNYISDVLAEVGYSKRGKLTNVLDSVIDQKLAEMQELEMSSSKDILELITQRHKMRIDEMKLEAEIEKAKAGAGSTNIQVNNNYSSLMEKLIKA